MSWSSVVKQGVRQPLSYAAVAQRLEIRTETQHRVGGVQTIRLPASRAVSAPFNNRMSSGPCADPTAPHSSPGETQAPPAGGSTSQYHHIDCSSFPELGTSVQSCSSSASSCSSTQDQATSRSSKPSTTNGTSGRKRGLCYQNASQHQLAGQLQSDLSSKAFKHKLSPSKTWAQERKNRALANRTVSSHVHIGAAVMGKCIGFGPGPYAQVEALEQLLQEQNPANWHDTITKHQQLAAAERVQQLAASRPALLCALQRQQQLADFDGLVDQHQLAAADADIAACLQREMAQQKLAESASETRPAFTQSSCEATADLEVPDLTAETQIEMGQQELAESASEARSALTNSTCEATVDYKVSELTAAMQAATLQDTVTDTASSTSGSYDDPADAADSSDLTSEAATSSSDDFSLGTSHSPPVQSAPPLMQADVDRVRHVAKQTSNCAYGIQAERDMIKEFDKAAQQAQHAKQAQHAQQCNYSWYKMGVPDVLPLGEHSGITFELGCQIDRALCHSRSSTAVPVEFKNRRHRFPLKLPAHECVQVQAQLQLCNAPVALLVERLQLAGEPVICQDHQILKQDRWWDRKLLPALHNFLAVFAVLATQQQELDLYFRKRACGQHCQHLKALIRQQAVQANDRL